jgi:hypothetical protein
MNPLREYRTKFFIEVNCVIYCYTLEIISNHLKAAKSTILEAKKKDKIATLGEYKGNF